MTVLVPGLLGQEENLHVWDMSAIPPVPELEFLLARSIVEQQATLNMEALLFDLFKVVIDDYGDLPVAAVTYALDSHEPREGYWLRADPVFLQTDVSNVVLQECEGLNIPREEANILVAELNAQFPADEWIIEAPVAGRWHMHLPEDPGIRTYPLPEVLGRSVVGFLPFGEQAMGWHTMLNEIQMVLHDSTINQEREMRGELPINSLWLWGGGGLPDVPSETWAQVWGHEPLSRGLAYLSHTPHAELPLTGAEWVEIAVAPGRHLVVLDGGRRLAERGDFDSWCNYLQALNKLWFTPLLKALKTGQLLSVTICPFNGQVYRTTPYQLKRMWKRSRSIASYIGKNNKLAKGMDL